MSETNAEELKQEIDTSKNEKIELQEMEDFLKTDENIKKLGNALETNVPPKIIEEYMNAIGELCDKIIDSKEKEKKITLNQFKILSLYFKHYNTENGNKKTYEKVKKIIKNLYKNYYKEQDNYLKGKGEKPTDPVAEYFENLQQEKINELNESIRNSMEQMQMENDPLYKKAKEDSERMDKLLEKWENDKQEIEEILQKSGIKTEEEIKKLTYFRDYYYKEGHILYKRDRIEEELYNQLSNELGGRPIDGIIGYDEIANRIDEVEQLYILSKEIDSELFAPEGELNNTLSNLESLGIKRKTKLNRKNIKNDIKTTNDINTIITKESIKKYIEIPQNTPEENYEYIAENIRILLSQHFSLNQGRKSLIFGGDATGMNLENLYKNTNYELKLHKELENLGNLDNQINILTKRPIKNSDLLEIWLKTAINKDNRENILSKLYNNIPLNQSISFFQNYNNRHKDSCINIQDYRLFRIQELGKKNIDSQINTILTLLPTDHEFLELWLNSKKNNQETVLTKLFDKIPSSTFFQICNKNKFINKLKNNYALYWLNKNNSINTDNKTYCFLDWKNKSKFDSFYGKGIKISEGLSFDELYEKTKNFYEGLKVYNISPKIPIPNILEFYDKVKKLQPRLEQIKKQYGKSMGEVSDMRNNPTMNIGSPTIGGGFGSGANLSEQSTKKIFDRDKAKIMTDLAEAYAKLLLKDPTMRGKKITAPTEFGGFTLDFSKTTPKAVVIDSFKENIEEQRNLFLYNLKNDRQAAFGSFMGMVGGIAGSAAAAIISGNILVTSAGFTTGLRLGNGLGQELWNSGEFLYEQISGNKINDGNNKVENFGQGFLRGVGALDQNYEYIGTRKFLSGLGFDYASTVATFGLSKKFGGFLGKLEGVKFAGGALKFGMEELILENFFVDIPMNIAQTGLEAVTGIDNGGVTVGNTSMGNERTVKGEKPYEKGSLTDMLRAMKDAATENLSFENLSQTFFNTMIYGGFLEGGGAAIKKMKNHLPAGQVANFTERSKAAANAFAGLTNFMNEKNITFNKDRICIDTKTNTKIEESDQRLKELATHIKAVEATKAGVIESFEKIMETQRQMVSNPENKTGLLFRLGLISSTNTPLNILKKKKELVEKRLENARKKGDKDKEKQLQNLLDIYTDAEQKLSDVTANKPEIGQSETKEDNTNSQTTSNETEQNQLEIKVSPEINQIAQILGAKFHEIRKNGRLKEDGTYESRIEKTTDQEWITKHHGQTEVDIAKTNFEDLPNDRKQENLEAAKVAAGLVYDKVKNGEEITPETIEKMSEIVHNKRLERNGKEGSFEHQRVTYDQLSEEEKAKDRDQVLQAIETIRQINDSEYFDGKSQKIFNVENAEGKAIENSKEMDRVLNEINREGISQDEISSKLQELRKNISEQYKQTTGEELNLTDEQLLSILDAHEQDGKLGKLTIGQLKQKVKILDETITDPKIRRFLLEAGFCGQEGINDNYKQDINELGKNLNLSKGDIENIEESIELINKTPIQNGIRLGELPITEILNNNYEGIKDLVSHIPGSFQVLIFFRDYLAMPNQKLGQLEYERNKKLQEILSNFSEDIKNKCKNAGIDIDEKLRILKGEISLEEAKQICTDEEIIKLAQNKEGIINKHALEVAIKLRNWKIDTNEIGLIFILGNNEYMKIKELIEYLEKELSNANLSINNIGEIIQVGEYKKTYTDPFEANFYEILSHGKYRFEYLLQFFLIDGRRFTNLYKSGDFKQNLSISFMTNPLIWKHYREYKGERRKILTSLIYQSARAYISKEEKQALGDYKGVGYKQINKTANDPNNEISKIISQYLERMPLKEDIEVERTDPEIGIAEKIKLSINGETKTLSEILETGEKCDENNLEQSSFIRDSFISTTVHKYQQAPIVWHFTVKKGVGATYLDVLGLNSEGEVLLDKNCKITITKLDASGGGAKIYATVEKIGENDNPQREHQRVTYDQLSEEGKAKDGDQVLQAIETNRQINDSEYFDGKSQKIFNVENAEGKAIENSKEMDRVLNEINREGISQDEISSKLQELRKNISEQYKQATGEELDLTDEQLLSILDAHEQDGKLGELTIGQLKQKVKILDETITDPKIRRFLLEAGFCGTESQNLTTITYRLKKETIYSNTTIEKLLNFCQDNDDRYILPEQKELRIKYVDKIIENMIKEKYIPQILKMLETNLPNFRDEILSIFTPERMPVWKEYNEEFKKENAKKNKHTEASETSQMSGREKLSIILNKSIDDLKSIDSLTDNEKLLLINHAKNKLKSAEHGESWASLCEDPKKAFVAEYLYDLGFEIGEVKHLIRMTQKKGISFSILDAYKNYANSQLSTIPNEIFDKNKMIDVLIKCGFVPYDGYYFANRELDLATSTTRGDHKILTTDDIDIMHRMINIGDHKNFWKILTPQMFLTTFYQFKSMFEKENVGGYREPYQFSSMIDRVGENFFDKILTEYENSGITEDEAQTIHSFVANDHRRINNAMINGYTGSYRKMGENLRRLIQRFTVDETLELNRTERDTHRFDEVKLKDGTTLTQIMQNINQYADRIDEINEELRGRPLHNKAFMSTTQGHLHNPMGYSEGKQINWLIYLEKGSHALFRNIYSQTSQGELEYIVQADSDIIFQIEIVKRGGTIFPKLIGYVKTP